MFNGSPIIATYDYSNESGELLFQVARTKAKEFPPRRRDENGKWTWGLGDLPRVLYRLPELLRAKPNQVIFIVEGEKDADNLSEIGLIATTNAGGAGNWQTTSQNAQCLYDRKIAILPDNDLPGRNHAEQVARTLYGKADKIKIIELQDLPESGDVSDWLKNGGTAQRLMEIAIQAPTYRPKESPQSGVRSNESAVRSPQPTDFDLQTPDSLQYHFSDLGNANRLIDLRGRDLQWCEAWAKWLAWDGLRWKIDDTKVIRHRAEEVSKAIYAEAAAQIDKERRRELARWALKVESQARTRDLLEMAKHKLAVRPQELDTDAWLLNCTNGTINLQTGELQPHDHDDLITKLVEADYDPQAKCERWDKFLIEITDDNPDLIRYLQQIVGLCLTGDISEHILLIFWGAGRNGKSTFIDTILNLLNDYAGPAPPSLFVIRKYQEHATELAALQGKRFVVGAETEQGDKLRTSLLKQLTGDSMITARFMRADYFQFPRTHKTLLVTNNKPTVSETTLAIWRRIKLIPFIVSIPEFEPDEQGRVEDKHLTEKLRTEWSGILAWAVRGCLDWQENGLIEPDEVREATAEYRSEEDRLAEFFAEHCEFDRDAWTATKELWKRYRQWADESNIRYPVAKKTFIGRLAELNCRPTRMQQEGKRQERGWKGICFIGDTAWVEV